MEIEVMIIIIIRITKIKIILVHKKPGSETVKKLESESARRPHERARAQGNRFAIHYIF